MEQPRRKIIVNVMVPLVMALIVLRLVMTRQSMDGIQTVNVGMLLLTGALFGMALAQAITTFRKTT